MGTPRDDRISYPPILYTLGVDHEQQWREAAHTEIKRVQGSITDTWTFGDVPAARAYAEVYKAAYRTYEETLHGIREDLIAAGSALAQAKAAMDQHDLTASDSFAALAPRWSEGQGFSSDERQDAATRDQDVQEGAVEKVRLENEAAPEGAPADGSPAADPSMDTGDTPAGGPDPSMTTE